MTRCRIKLCGLRTEAEVDLAAALGADAVGFVLTPSPRRITPGDCRRLRDRLPAGIRVHGVFAGESAAEIRRLTAECRLDAVQLHGLEDDPDARAALSDLPAIFAYRVRGPETLALLEAERSRLFLLDAWKPGEAGGTGETFDWAVARAAGGIGRVILAGGLTPENVAAAIAAAQPWMVDVSSGIERERGVKDPARMRAFVEAVRAADQGAAGG